MADSNRVICSRCGANNFNTQAACWKCGAALVGGVAAGASVPAFNSSLSTPSTPLSPAVPIPGLERDIPPDPTIAVGAAVAMAVLFPSVGLIVGLIFLMFDNRRRVEIGKITLIWSVIFFVVHTVATGILLPIMARNAMAKILPGLGNLHAPAQPGLNDRVPPDTLPSGFNMP